MTTKKVFAVQADKGACGLYRIDQPYSKLSKMDRDISFEIFDTEKNKVIVSEFVNKLRQYDAVVFQRVWNKNICAIMYALKKFGIKIYMDVDDDIFSISNTSPCYTFWQPKNEAIKVFSKCLSVIDGLFVSTPELADGYKDKVNCPITVFRNALDTKDEKYNISNSLRNKLPQDKTIIMWTGSSTHLDDLMIVANDLRPIFDKYKNVSFALCSNKEFLDLFDIDEDQKIYVPHVPLEDFYNIPSMCDIAITPLKLSKFNDGKSELKCMEHGIWEVPCVSSPAAPYLRYNTNGNGESNLIAKKNRGQEWCKQIEKLILDETLRKEMGKKSKELVINHYDLDLVNEEKYSFFERELYNK